MCCSAAFPSAMSPRSRSIRQDSSLARVDILVKADTPIRTDSVATLAMQGITGGVLVEISRGTKTAQRLKTGLRDPLGLFAPRASAERRARGHQQGQCAARPRLDLSQPAEFDGLRRDPRQSGPSDRRPRPRLRPSSTACSRTADTAVKQVTATALEIQKLASDLRDSTGKLVGSADKAVGQIRTLAGTFNKTAGSLDGLIQENRQPIHDFTSPGPLRAHPDDHGGTALGPDPQPRLDRDRARSRPLLLRRSPEGIRGAMKRRDFLHRRCPVRCRLQHPAQGPGSDDALYLDAEDHLSARSAAGELAAGGGAAHGRGRDRQLAHRAHPQCLYPGVLRQGRLDRQCAGHDPEPAGRILRAHGKDHRRRAGIRRAQAGLHPEDRSPRVRGRLPRRRSHPDGGGPHERQAGRHAPAQDRARHQFGEACQGGRLEVRGRAERLRRCDRPCHARHRRQYPDCAGLAQPQPAASSRAPA